MVQKVQRTLLDLQVLQVRQALFHQFLQYLLEGLMAQ